MEDKTIANLGEFGLIDQLFTPIQQAADSGVRFGIGDDAAVLDVPRTQDLLTTTDTMVEGIHFSSDADPYLLGQKALRVNLSDIAAMGGVPRWYTLSIATPASAQQTWMEEFARGLKEASETFNVALVGGDTVRSNAKIVITIQLMGLIGQDRSVMRSGGQVGDRLFVSGTLGDSAFGLAHLLGKLQGGLSADDLSFFSRRHDLPEPRIELATKLQDAALVHAMIDISDGLVADLTHICRASKVAAKVDFEKLPLSDAAGRMLTLQADMAEKLILTGGEDYELLFAVNPAAVGEVEKMAAQAGIEITDIGELVKMHDDHDQVTILKGGEPVKLTHSGWTHF
uniref:Thiamine-monophosphate kinase n=1 Tax=Magnetococcus massalia (strain MO-1) TaxID=451514 RepID=A0A1S7LNR6_MAGMO|nr:putative thiamin-monophosphate kinase [Candidatus Magnetococcus massalia]